MDDPTCAGGCTCQGSAVADDRGSVSRRGVLAGSAAAMAALALGACAGSAETASGSSPTSPEPTTPDSTTPEPSPTEPSAQDTQSSDGGTSGEAIAATGFPVGGGVVVASTSQGPVVVTQPADGEYRGFNARCPHAGCPVAEVLENTIICNCHGSTFDASTGDRLEGPAPTGLEPVAIQVSDGEIYLA
jgi:nitrite reductase/ring-hydroxylating ferredoxin subunit